MPVIQDVSDYSQSEDNLPDATNPEKQLQLFVKQMLQSRLFIGKFQEKRYVDSLQSYRDVIIIDNEETDLIRDLDVVKNRLRGFFGQDLWIGITGPEMVGTPAGNCLWVELPDQILGSYWYKISRIRFRTNEVLIKLKVVRPVPTSNTFAGGDSFAFLKKASPKKTVTDDDSRNENVPSSETYQQEGDSFSLLQQKLNELLNSARNNVCLFVTTVLTINNTKEAIRFLSIFLAALVTGAVKFVEYLGDFSLRFMREASVFVNSATPIIIAFINLIGKIIGGFYLLILSMWRDRKGPQPVYNSPYVNQNRMITGGNGYNTVYFKRPNTAPGRNYRSSVQITPLD